MPHLFFIFRDPHYLDWAKPYFKIGLRQHHLSSIRNIDILDNDFNNPDEVDFRRLLDQYSPAWAIAPDLFVPQDLAGALQLIKDYPHTRFILVPKYDCVREIPREVILGYPMSTAFGGNFPLKWFLDRPVHLLGGTPIAQRKKALFLDVVSLDCNNFTKVGLRSWKAFHAQAPHWRQHPELTQKQLFELSCAEIKRYWEIPIPKLKKLSSIQAPRPGK
jgi:hypothetical protein